MTEQKEQKKWVKIVGIVANVIFYVLIALMLIFSITNLTRKDEYEVASIFGRGYCTVKTGSMAGGEKDSFTENDLIFVKKVNDKNREKLINNLEVGQIITFKYFDEKVDSKKEFLNTHRIVYIEYEKNSDKVLYFITQGDANAEKFGAYNHDENDMSSCEKVLPMNVRAIYTGQAKGLGKVMKYLQTSNGFMLCVVIPMALIFVVMLLFLVLNILNIKKAKTEEQHSADLEALKAQQEAMLAAEKERIRAEILAEQAAQKEAEQPKEE